MSELDRSLIAEFSARRSEDAFAALVRQHVNLVFATALRQVGDAGAAEEITQNVFVALAQAAGKLGSHPTIAGWLHQTALNKSREWLRSELRRRRREQVAVNLELARAEGDSVWSSLVPLLDEALLELRELDRLAVILHFMEGRTFHEVGSALGIGEDTARKRVNRCLDQLTHFFRRRGFAAPALEAGAPLFTLSSHAAPAGLAASATTAGLAAAHSAASASTLTLIKGALKIMAWTKAKTAIVAGVIVALTAGTTMVAVYKHKVDQAEINSWRLHLSPDSVSKAPPQVRILPTKFKPPVYGAITTGNGKWAGNNMPVRDLVRIAYDWPPARVFFPDGEPKERYDFATTLPKGGEEALQEKIKQIFGYVVQPQTRDMDVLALRIQNPDAPGLKPHVPGTPVHGIYDYKGGITAVGLPISMPPPRPYWGLTRFLEIYLQKPVVDETGLTGRYDIQFRWKERYEADPEHDAMKQVMLNQIGLELVPTNMPVDVLVIEKAKN